MSYSINEAVESWVEETALRWESLGKTKEAEKLRELAKKSLEDAFWYLKSVKINKENDG